MFELTLGLLLLVSCALCVRWYLRIKRLEAHAHYQERRYLELLETVLEMDETYQATAHLLDQAMAMGDANALMARAVRLKEP